MERKRRMARINVSEQLIRHALAIPDDTTIYTIYPSRYNPGVFEFVVENDRFPPLEEGYEPPIVTPVITTIHENRPETWMKFEWE